LAFKSKSERGYELMEGGPDTPAKAATIDLLANMCTRDAFKMIGLACLKQVVDNVPALIKSDPEGVHQMRVGLRRLRPAMRCRGILRSTSAWLECYGFIGAIEVVNPAFDARPMRALPQR